MNMSDSFIRAWEITKEYDLDDIPEEFKNGNCYQCAANHVMGNSKTHTLAHTMVSGQGALRGRRYGHAFTLYNHPKTGDEMVHDPNPKLNNGKGIDMDARAYFALGNINPDEVKRYTHEEMGRKLIDTEQWGPWDE